MNKMREESLCITTSESLKLFLGSEIFKVKFYKEYLNVIEKYWMSLNGSYFLYLKVFFNVQLKIRNILHNFNKKVYFYSNESN